MAFRVDYSGTLGKLQRTPQGGYRVPATIAKVGVLTYSDGKGGVVREYNPPEVLQAAIESLRDAPVTREHPTEGGKHVKVRTDNFQRHAKGFVSGLPEYRDGMVHAFLAVQDAELIADIESGARREVSAGYDAAVEATPGMTPQGEPYDVIRTRIDFNHAAVVRSGRAGADVRLRLDAAGDVELASDSALDNEQVAGSANATLESSMTKLKIDGAEHAVESAQAVIDGAIAKRDAAVTKAESERDKEKARADAADAKVKELETKLAEAIAPARVDAAVTARLALVEQARKVCGEKYDASGKTEAQIVSEVAAKAHPKLDLKDKSDAYVRALFDAAVTDADADPDGLRLLRGERVIGAEPTNPIANSATRADTLSPREQMVRERYEAGRKPLTSAT